MVNRFKMISLFSLVLCCSAIYAMKLPPFKVEILNNFGAELRITYQKIGRDQEILRTVQPGQPLDLGTNEELKGTIKIEYYTLSVLVSSEVIQVADLIQKIIWLIANKNWPENAVGLLITLKPGGRFNTAIVPSYDAVGEETIRMMNMPASGPSSNPLDAFRFRYPVVQQALKGYDIIGNLKDWDDVPKGVNLEGGWVVGRATTAEDIARYMFDLPNAAYTQASVMEVAEGLLARRNPANAYDQKVIALINWAIRILKQALREKAQSGTSVEEVEFSRPTAGTAQQKNTRQAIESAFIGKVVTSFPSTIFQERIDFSGWNSIAGRNGRVQAFVEANAANNPQILADLKKVIGFSEALVHIINETYAKINAKTITSADVKIAHQSLTRIAGIAESAKNEIATKHYSEQGQQESNALLVTLAGYIHASALGVAGQTGSIQIPHKR